ncbi:MAG: tetratricopeptide repeat protein [Gammaproteobacteria bacterium]
MLNRKHLLATSVVLFLSLAGTIAVSQQPAPRDASVDSDIQRAQSLYESGRSQDALDVVDAVLDKVAGDAEARFLQGLIYADLNRRDEAIRVFTALTDDFPELPEPWNNLAVLFAENGEFDKARQSLLAAIQTHPSYSTAHENLGDLYARMASMAYDRALEQDRGNESARLKLSAVNGLFSVPSLPATTQVAATTPSPAPQPVAVTPSPATPEPVEQPPVTTPAVTVARVDPDPEPEPVEIEPTAPVPATPVAQPTVSDATVRSAVENAVRGWASSWSAQDVDGYLDSYGPSFRPANGASRASWNRYRRERLTKPSFIAVDLTEMNIELNDAQSATATFVQRYRSDNYEDQVRKTLEMVRTDGRWQIASEASQ